ncbi:dedicator of cytokinesis protein 5-like isoform X2 [Athene noctua]|uniref:dedicator of cytokinesis protein 5-like isoform X2 n=1 Tax=Athene noctua TaxID=126797 RepID=UPI003EBD9B03
MTLPLPKLQGDIRSDICVTLVQGDFDKGSRTAAKTAEVTVSVYDEDGKRLEIITHVFCTYLDSSCRLTPNIPRAKPSLPNTSFRARINQGPALTLSCPWPPGSRQHP